MNFNLELDMIFSIELFFQSIPKRGKNSETNKRFPHFFNKITENDNF